VLEVQDLSYTVQNRAKRRERLTLLDSVSGVFKAGQMSALVRAVLRGHVSGQGQPRSAVRASESSVVMASSHLPEGGALLRWAV